MYVCVYLHVCLYVYVSVCGCEEEAFYGYLTVGELSVDAVNVCLIFVITCLLRFKFWFLT